jgi:hypothetical protein
MKRRRFIADSTMLLHSPALPFEVPVGTSSVGWKRDIREQCENGSRL